MSDDGISKDHFLVLAAKDFILAKYGPVDKLWPDNNFWAMVSTIKYTIREDQIPALMSKYGLTRLSDFLLK